MADSREELGKAVYDTYQYSEDSFWEELPNDVRELNRKIGCTLYERALNDACLIIQEKIKRESTRYLELIKAGEEYEAYVLKRMSVALLELNNMIQELKPKE